MEKLNRLDHVLHMLRIDPRMRGEALRIIDEIREGIATINMSNIARITLPALDRLANAVAEAEKSLTELSMLIQSGKYNEALEKFGDVVVKIARLMALNSLISGSYTTKTTGLLTPIDTTDIVKQCGGIAGRLYGYIIKHGKPSSQELEEYTRNNGINKDEAEKAIECLLRREYITTINDGGEIYYIAAPR